MPQQLGNLVFDRTEFDVAQLQAVTAKLVAGTATAEEKAVFLAGDEGKRTTTRTLTALGLLWSILRHCSIRISIVPTLVVTGWQEGDIQYEEQMAQYLTNIQELRNRLPYVAPDAPTDMLDLTYQEANDIEEILYTLEDVLETMQAAFLTRQANTLL